ncbi:glycosyltransferase [Flavobacterium sp. F372]|uniref:Glycosyltransferase n=1 Tax=Flavobacterium bernardetii TaxID=2813823 RepID=A0ABR7IV37_9FLAO|nr:glycosyltransferase [Flavobacterium bernardetii]MBC5833588.1 glycosyltransferase [Flavobacterium bernardetii]NHF68821.1 glycosyltransferase [Flavobacterium bernardetii]
MKIVIVIPFYNEVERINLENFHVIFNEFPHYNFLLVDDGSLDNTIAILEQFQSEFLNVEVLKLDKNVGKAEAIRSAVLSISEADFISYYDADLATPFSELDKLIQFSVQNPNYKMVMGARIKLIGNGVQRSLKRHYFGRIFATIVSQFVLKVPVYDTQCGAKVIVFHTAKQIFEKPFISKWLFDVELLKRLQKIHDLRKVVKEIPLEKWEEIGNSKIKVRDFLRIPFQLFQIYRKYD